MKLQREEGMYSVLFSIMGVALFAVLAVVTDLGAARSQARSNQSMADLAALAGAPQLPDDPRQACLDAWNFLRTNTEDDLPAGATMPCASLPAVCTPATVPATYVASGADPYTIRIRYPVSDADIAPAQTADGAQCDRIKVSITKRIGSSFAAVIGMGNMHATAEAVGKATEHGDTSYSLVVLDPWGCDNLTVNSNAQVRVSQMLSGDIGGRIAIDSAGVTSPPDGSSGCGASDPYTLDPGGSGSSPLIVAEPTLTGQPGKIDLFGLYRGQFTCAGGNPYACDPDDVTAGRLSPQPTRAIQRVTRAPLDHHYNCKSTYPAYHTLALAPCPEAATRAPYIDHLVGEIGQGPGLPVPPNGGVFLPYSGPCNVTPANVVVVPAGNWYVDCPDATGLVVRGSLTFLGGNVVFQEGVKVNSGGVLNVNTANVGALPPSCQTAVRGCVASSSANASFVYFRNGPFEKEAQGTVTFNRVFGYFSPSGSCGPQQCIKLTGGAGPVVWTAPTEGPFAKLAIWNEHSNDIQLTGSATVSITGIVFASEAEVEIAGNACMVLQSQFVVYQLHATGQGCVHLDPDVTTGIALAPANGGLIR